ncbi:MAG: type IV conjugative transfer system protein TraE [Gammaproteobacteria bacterium]|nr:type IV conjugative transfer system protein TraE [Gammaproteobacteria bacterium]
MLKKIRDSKIAKLNWKKNYLSIGLGASIVANLVLSISISTMIGKERIVLLWPDSADEFWVTPKKVSASYLKEVSQYLLLTTLNVTPQTAPSRREMFMNYVHPSGYGEIKSQLILEEDVLKKKNISKMFSPIGYEVDEKSLKVKAIGELTTWVSKEKISQERVIFTLGYKMNIGKVQLIEFKEELHEKKM